MRTALVALALAACSRASAPPDAGLPAPTPAPTTTPTSTPAPTTTSTSTSTSSSTSPSPPTSPPPAALPISAAVVKTAAGEEPLSRDGVTMIEPGAAFRVEVAVHLTDGRLSIHDEQDAMVASSGTTEVGDTWTRYELAPDEPLRPGSSYALRLDGAQAREAHDPAGKAYAPAVLKLRTTGVHPPPPPTAKAKAKVKRGKRRR